MSEEAKTLDDPGQLGHDARTHLLIVSMGLEVLEASRENADRFAEVLQKIRQDGVGPLQEDLHRLIEQTRESESSCSPGDRCPSGPALPG